MSTTEAAQSIVWVFLVERPLSAGGDLSLYAAESTALEGARAYVLERWPADKPLPADPEELVDAYNLLDVDEFVIVGPWTVASISRVGH